VLLKPSSRTVRASVVKSPGTSHFFAANLELDAGALIALVPNRLCASVAESLRHGNRELPTTCDVPVPRPWAEHIRETSRICRRYFANRENAKKSTGPRTARGKAYSRKNAIKHGLFTRNMFEILMLGESQAEYDLLLDDLHKEYEPIGRAKELEVERIADCWWRLQRARRYEESVIRNSYIRGAKELEQFERDCKARDQEREATIRGLENMVAELSVAREVPPDLKQRFFALTSLNEQHWQRFDEMGEEWLKAKASRDPELAGILPTREGSPGRASRTLQAAIDWYEVQSQSATPIGMKMAFGHYVIPDRDDLDKLLRYETTIERSLDRALNRLERLQKMRPRKRRDSKAAAEGAETTADASCPES